MSPRTSAPTFPPTPDAAEPPARADTSHVVRRRASSAPAHEVDLDEVELFDESAGKPVPWAAPAASLPLPSFPDPDVLPSFPDPDLEEDAPVSAVRAAPTVIVAEPVALSTAPVAIESPSHAPFSVPIRPGIIRRRSTLAIAASYALLAVAVGTVTGLFARSHAPRVAPPTVAARAPELPPAESITTTPAAQEVTPAVSTPALAAPVASAPQDAVPVVDVAKLPRARDGQIVGAAGHRLWIDGALAATWQVTVACGPHVVQVGSAGTPRTVEVPCGESVTVAP